MCLTQKNPALFPGRVELFLIIFVHVFSRVCLRGEQRGEGRLRRGDVQSRQLSLFSEGEGSLADEPGLVSRGGDTEPAAGRGRRRPERVRGAPRERVVGPPGGVEPPWAGKPRRA